MNHFMMSNVREKKTLKFPTLGRGANMVRHYREEEAEENPNAAAELLFVCELPEALVGEILSWVPAKMVFRCKSVSKPWLYAIEKSHTFAKEHFAKSKACPLLIFRHVSGRQPTRTLNMVEGTTACDFMDPKLKLDLTTRVEFPDHVKGPTPFIRFLNTQAVSCEGLVCWPTRRGAGGIIISNPVTGEHIALNLSDTAHAASGEEFLDSTFIGLGYSEKTGTFELLRMALGRSNYTVEGSYMYVWWPEVCTVGSNVWSRGKMTHIPADFNFSRIVLEIFYIHGKMYWRYQEQASIYCFDFDEHMLYPMPLPKYFGFALDDGGFVCDFVKMGPLGDHLSVTMVSPLDGHVEMWALKHNEKGGHVWNRTHSIETLTTLRDYTGWVMPMSQYRPVMYVENDKILMHDWRCTFLLYNTTTRSESFVSLAEFPTHKGSEHDFFLQVVPHVPRILPLRETLKIQDPSIVVHKIRSRRTRKRGPAKSQGASTSQPKRGRRGEA